MEEHPFQAPMKALVLDSVYDADKELRQRMYRTFTTVRAAFRSIGADKTKQQIDKRQFGRLLRRMG